MGALVVSLAEAWWGWMGPMLLQSSILFGLLLAVDRLGRHRLRPGLRMALWVIGLTRLLVPPSFHLPFSLVGLFTSGGAPAAAGPSLIPATGLSRWIAAASTVWLAGALGLIALEITRHVMLPRRLAREAATARWPAWLNAEIGAAARAMQTRPPARVIASSRAATPAVTGVIRPWLILPAALARQAGRADASHMLLHEMAHLKRRDPLLRAACRMLASLYWLNPLVWIATRRIAALAELCCDARVAAALGPRREGYRRTLLRGARFLLEPRRDLASAALGFHGGASLLAQRLAWMERPARRPGPLRRLLAGGTIAAAALLIVPMGTAPITEAAPGAATILEARLLLGAAASGQRVSSLRLQQAARVLSASQNQPTPPQGD